VERERLRSIIESLLFISGEPLALERMVQAIGKIDKKDVRMAVDELAGEYMKQGRGLRVSEIAGGFQLETARENAEYLARLVKTRPIRLTRPSLETMAIIAYRQPVTRVEVDQIRGVDSSGVIKTLLEFGFIQIVGRKDVPGRPLLYGSSKKFLEFFRLKNLADLPSLDEFFAQIEEQQAQNPNLFENRYQENTEPKPSEPDKPDASSAKPGDNSECEPAAAKKPEPDRE